jgi:hypothetical protein
VVLRAFCFCPRLYAVNRTHQDFGAVFEYTSCSLRVSTRAIHRKFIDGWLISLPLDREDGRGAYRIKVEYSFPRRERLVMSRVGEAL